MSKTRELSSIIIHSMILISAIVMIIEISKQVSSFISNDFSQSIEIANTYFITVGICLFAELTLGALYFINRNKNSAISNNALSALNYLSTIISIVVTFSILTVLNIIWTFLLIDASKIFFGVAVITLAVVVFALLATVITALVTSLIALNKAIKGQNDWTYPSLSGWLFSTDTKVIND